jgi:Xaa-Pro aminopeptidase
MAPIESVTAADFEKTAPYTPGRDLTAAAGELVILTVSVEGLGGISDYSVRIELPAFDDHLKAIAQIVYQVHAAAFALNWPGEPEDQEDR